MHSRASVTKSTKKHRGARKPNLLKLFSIMNKLTHDAVDKEVIKRFKILIEANEDDITKAELQVILKNPENINLSVYHEGLQPYIKHYVFMYKRTKTK
jgi:hypothetical protein